MPVVWHQVIGRDSDATIDLGFHEDRYKGDVVCEGFKEEERTILGKYPTVVPPVLMALRAVVA